MTNKMYLMTGRPGAGKTEFVENGSFAPILATILKV